MPLLDGAQQLPLNIPDLLYELSMQNLKSKI
jgi:hypothetical protein